MTSRKRTVEQTNSFSHPDDPVAGGCRPAFRPIFWRDRSVVYDRNNQLVWFVTQLHICPAAESVPGNVRQRLLDYAIDREVKHRWENSRRFSEYVSMDDNPSLERRSEQPGEVSDAGRRNSLANNDASASQYPEDLSHLPEGVSCNRGGGLACPARCHRVFFGEFARQRRLDDCARHVMGNDVMEFTGNAKTFLNDSLFGQVEAGVTQLIGLLRQALSIDSALPGAVPQKPCAREDYND